MNVKMNWTKWTKQEVFRAVIGPLLLVFLFGVQSYADDRYILRAESKQSLISQYQEKIYLLRKNGVTPSEQEDIDFYNFQIEKLGGSPT